MSFEQFLALVATTAPGRAGLRCDNTSQQANAFDCDTLLPLATAFRQPWLEIRGEEDTCRRVSTSCYRKPKNSDIVLLRDFAIHT